MSGEELWQFKCESIYYELFDIDNNDVRIMRVATLTSKRPGVHLNFENIFFYLKTGQKHMSLVLVSSMDCNFQ